MQHHRWIVGWSIAFLASLSGTWFAPLNAKDKPEIKVELDADEIFVGESVMLQVDVLNVNDPSPPSTKELEADFVVEPKGEQSLNQFSTTIINGRISQQNILRHIYQFSLTPKSVGEKSIPSLSATLDGTILQSKPKKLLVREIPRQDDVVLETVVKPAVIYPTQSSEVTLRVFVKALPGRREDPLQPLKRQPPQLNVPWVETPGGLIGPDKSTWLRNLLSDRGYGFKLNEFNTNSGFLFDGPKAAVFDLLTGKEKRSNLSGVSQEYFRYELTQTLTANKVGEYTFGPATVKGTFVVGVERDEYRGSRIVAISPPVTLTVREVPSPRPNNYLGGVGAFDVSVSATPLRLRVGDPLTMTLDVTAKESPTSLKMVSAPDLSRLESIAKDFDVIDREPVGRSNGSVKSFTYGLRPKSVNASIPELTFSTFDPKTESFVDLKSRSVPVEIVESKSLDTTSIVGSRSEKPTSVQVDRSGIFQGTSEMYPIRNETASLARWATAAGGSWIVSIATVLLVRLRSRAKGDAARQRRAMARSIASNHLSAAHASLRNSDPPGALIAIRQSIVELVANFLHLQGEGLTTANVLESISLSSLSDDLRSELRGLLEGLDASQYGGSSMTDAEEMLRKAERLMDPLATALQQGSRRTQRVMTKALLVTAFCMLPLQAVGSESPTRDSKIETAFHALQAASTTSDFEMVARSFETIRDQGVEGGAIHFHIANAWYRAGQYGKAIYHYRLAKFYMPRDTYLESNLQQALSLAPGRLTNDGNSILDKVLFWSYWISHPNKIRWTSGLAMLSAVGFAVGLLRGARSLWMTSLIMLLIAGFVAGEGLIRSPEAYASSRGVVTMETVARKGMGESYAPAFLQPLKDGAEFEVIQSTSDWTLGRFPGIGDGWVRNTAILKGLP